MCCGSIQRLCPIRMQFKKKKTYHFSLVFNCNPVHTHRRSSLSGHCVLVVRTQCLCRSAPRGGLCHVQMIHLLRILPSRFRVTVCWIVWWSLLRPLAIILVMSSPPSDCCRHLVAESNPFSFWLVDRCIWMWRPLLLEKDRHSGVDVIWEAHLALSASGNVWLFGLWNLDPVWSVCT